jgi:uncharacterized membrane protein YcaP (DUF421 family)
MFFDNWHGILRVLVVGILAYTSLVLFVRISGKRTLAKMNAFDLVVTVALGSTLASILLTRDVALVEGMLALALLILLQFLVAWISVRSEAMRRLVKAEPSLLFHHGRFLDDVLRRERVTREEVGAAIRAAGQARLDDVGAVVLETDGSFSVLPRASGALTALSGVRHAPEQLSEQVPQDLSPSLSTQA